MKNTNASDAIFSTDLGTIETSSYECPGNHRAMIADAVRTDAYAKAIKKTVKKGDTVIDIGAGSGILSFFAARAGAKKVYALERSNTANWIEELVKKNNLQDIVEVIRQDSRDFNLKEKVDVIISECIGYMGLDENMFDAVLDARNRLLQPQGKIIPASLTMYAALVYDRAVHDVYINYWDDKIYDFDFTPMKQHGLNTIYITEASKKALVSEPAILYFFDVYKAKTTNLRSSVKLRVKRKSVVNGFYCWFDVKLSDKTHILTDLFHEETHWLQCFLPANKPFEATPDDHIEILLDQRLLNKEERDKLLFEWKIKKNNVLVSEAKSYI